jgi:hypothetical protein
MIRNSAEEKIMAIGRKKMALDHVLIERMDREDEAGDDLESILRHGAQGLFEDDSGADDIVYDSASVDRLLDRSQIEDTKTSEEKSAESQFSFARIWANDKSTLEEDMPDTGTNTPNPGIWDKILQERERVFAEEQARKEEAFGRGKRKRQVSWGCISHVGMRTKLHRLSTMVVLVTANPPNRWRRPQVKFVEDSRGRTQITRRPQKSKKNLSMT